MPCGHLARLVGVLRIERIHRPTLLRDFGDGVLRGPQNVGEAVRVAGTAGKPHAHPNDRDRLAAR